MFRPYFEVKITPSALVSGASQLEQIAKLIDGCAFAIVALDGIRPNVIFEYGIIYGKGKPVILLKEEDATVDIFGYFGDAVGLTVAAPSIDVDKQFSDVKDQNYAPWNRFAFGKTVRLVWEEYRKKKDTIPGYVEIPEPRM